MRAVITIEADNPDSIRWYAREILKLHPQHPTWLDMECQPPQAPPVSEQPPCR